MPSHQASAHHWIVLTSFNAILLHMPLPQSLRLHQSQARVQMLNACTRACALLSKYISVSFLARLVVHVLLLLNQGWALEDGVAMLPCKPARWWYYTVMVCSK